MRHSAAYARCVHQRRRRRATGRAGGRLSCRTGRRVGVSRTTRRLRAPSSSVRWASPAKCAGVQQAERRAREAAKLGFRRCILPPVQRAAEQSGGGTCNFSACLRSSMRSRAVGSRTHRGAVVGHGRRKRWMKLFYKTLRMVAPGTHVVRRLEMILRARTGSLIVVGDTQEVLDLVNGGFKIDAEMHPSRCTNWRKWTARSF